MATDCFQQLLPVVTVESLATRGQGNNRIPAVGLMYTRVSLIRGLLNLLSGV